MELLKTPREIAAYNDRICAELGEGAGLYDLNRFRAGIARETLARWLEEGALPEEAFCLSGRTLTRGEREKIAIDRNAENLPAWAEARWGLSVRRTNLRRLPTKLALTQKRSGGDDLLQESAVLPGEPLALLHTSRDGRWLFAAAYFGRGWVRTDDVALCENWEEWRAAQEGAFLVVTASRMELEWFSGVPRGCEHRLTMGTRLRLAASAGTVCAVGKRMSYDNYIVSFPMRGRNGALRFAKALVPISADVHEGWLPYTRAALLAQAEKTRGEAYGWGGAHGARDCSALIGEVFRTFGFRLPRNAADLARLPGARSVAGWTAEKKRAFLQSLPAGAFLYFPGHVMLCLGQREGQLCCLSAAGNFRSPGNGAGNARAVNTVCVCPLDVVRANGQSWLDALTTVVPGV